MQKAKDFSYQHGDIRILECERGFGKYLFYYCEKQIAVLNVRPAEKKEEDSEHTTREVEIHWAKASGLSGISESHRKTTDRHFADTSNHSTVVALAKNIVGLYHYKHSTLV